MLHLSIESFAEETSAPYAEAVARLASIRHAMRLVDPFGGGPASDPSEDDEIGAAWADAAPAKRRRFDACTHATASAAAAGLEALLAGREANRIPNPAANLRLVQEIREGLEEVSRLMLSEERRTPVPAPFPIAL